MIVSLDAQNGPALSPLGPTGRRRHPVGEQGITGRGEYGASEAKHLPPGLVAAIEA